jgi:hypothetical protein
MCKFIRNKISKLIVAILLALLGLYYLILLKNSKKILCLNESYKLKTQFFRTTTLKMSIKTNKNPFCIDTSE